MSPGPRDPRVLRSVKHHEFAECGPLDVAEFAALSSLKIFSVSRQRKETIKM
jgi:hypothetical protein